LKLPQNELPPQNEFDECLVFISLQPMTTILQDLRAHYISSLSRFMTLISPANFSAISNNYWFFDTLFKVLCQMLHFTSAPMPSTGLYDQSALHWKSVLWKIKLTIVNLYFQTDAAPSLHLCSLVIVAFQNITIFRLFA
jgi:hypothetical protein